MNMSGLRSKAGAAGTEQSTESHGCWLVLKANEEFQVREWNQRKPVKWRSYYSTMTTLQKACKNRKIHWGGGGQDQGPVFSVPDVCTRPVHGFCRILWRIPQTQTWLLQDKSSCLDTAVAGTRFCLKALQKFSKAITAHPHENDPALCCRYTPPKNMG